MGLDVFKKPANDDCVEAEIVSGPGAPGNSGAETGRRRGNRPGRPEAHGASGPASQTTGGSASGVNPDTANIPFYGLFLKVKFLFITAILLASFGLIVLGLILTSTIVGAIIGIPLLLLGGILLWILFKLLTLGQKNQPIIFRRF
ncbi:MAG: hypothetical protein A2X28_02490 [Elusimicrobia bacterium GWA2_56_46]|nr:MAG: hypothetical protein A2X28_02490 [Elusimicrobia bacterium GWA2_56_46]OGR55369.1 MAG: hypothetical protein A2X39_00475 [Elusimicrobia bacterium GWC2_56_31]HBB68165.1 hypothetical protein [Elusimicrobiota bacterium]HBW21828.1 hypothetical protein [Elusimicrobiota bacterium]